MEQADLKQSRLSSDLFRRRLLLILFYGVSVAASFYFCWVKLNALGYHTRDFPFYYQFAAKVFNSSLSNIYTINPYGYNFLGLDGIEGMQGLYQTIHLEPIKFIYGFLISIFGTPLPIFLLFALIYFGPALYLGWHLPTAKHHNSIFAYLVSALLLLFPSSILAVADDLRPYTLLAPLLALTILSIHFRAPRWQSVLFFLGMLSCREEGLVFGLFLIAYALLRAGSKRQGAQDLRTYGAIWLGWCGITGLYYSWANYPVNKFLNPLAAWVERPTLSVVVIVWLAIFAGFALVALIWFKLSNQAAVRLAEYKWLQLGLIAAVFIPLFRQVSVSKGRKFDRMEFGDALFSVFKDFMLFPKFTLIFVMVIVMIAAIWMAVESKRVRSGICYGLALLVVGCLYLQTVPWMKTPWVWHERYEQRLADAALVWELRMRTDPYKTVILSDLDTYQAFADYEGIIVYERLPWAIEQSEARHYPANVNRTVEFLKDEVEYVVIAKEEESLAAIEQLFQLAQLQPTHQNENERYKIIRITR